MTKELKEIIIPKEKAVFWLDKNGRWHNKHGEFQHRKIIDYFHSSIRKDSDGYYLGQINENYKEKVYFHYEDTALFVFNVIQNKDIVLVLNTKKQIKLNPKKMFIREDNLYMQDGEEFIKFTERSMIKMSGYIEYDNDIYFINVNNKRYKIQKLEPKLKKPFVKDSKANQPKKNSSQ